eukprot:6807443-Lingulodinium_polyedra.AAC.1
MEQFKATYTLVSEIRSADPHVHHPNQEIYCGAAELSLRNVGLPVLVANIENIKTFTYVRRSNLEPFFNIKTRLV